MPFKFNPFTGNFDQTGSGGGGSSYIDGEVQNFSALPETLGSPAVDSAYLVREAEGTWLLNRKPAGIYIRTANTGTRASDWTYAGEFPDVFSDANLVIYNGTDSTKNVKFDASAIATGTTRTITVPDANITLDDAGDSRTPSSHSSSHASAGSDPLFDQDLNTFSGVTFNSINVGSMTATSLEGISEIVLKDNQDFTATIKSGEDFLTDFRQHQLPDANGTLALTSDIPALGAGAGEAAEGNHVHGNITTDGKIGSTSGLPVVTTTAGAVTTLALGTAGQVLTVNGTADGVEFAAASGSGVTGAAASASDVLGVSGSDITGVDATADRIVFWDDSANKLAYLEAGSGLSLSGTTLSATASGGSKTYAAFTATDNQPPATAFATYDTRSSIAVLDFDDATDESAVFVSIIPEGASLGSGLKIRLHWMATTATSGNCVWDVSLERMTTDLDSDSFDTIASGTAAANGTSGILTVTEITLTTIDSVTAGDGFRLKLTRDANNASDTMTGDAELVAVEVRSAA